MHYPQTTFAMSGSTRGPQFHPRVSAPEINTAYQESPFNGKKKPREAVGSSPQPPSKKKKLSGDFLYQSIEQSNDVTAVSGINLEEEAEQLFSGPKVDGRALEASQKDRQEEDRLILQKVPLLQKITEIMDKCGLESITSDVERCLSLSVDERMRELINNLIRLSKQRVDVQKLRSHTITTSNVQLEIMNLNKEAKKVGDKNQAENKKVQKLSETEVRDAVETDKNKDKRSLESFKANKEVRESRARAANVAALAAIGGDDVLSSWKLLAEQAWKKHESGFAAASVSHLSKDVKKPISTAGRMMIDNQEAENMCDEAGSRVMRSISVKDVIAVLERDQQMSKSLLMYRLYERKRETAPTSLFKTPE